MSDDKNDSAAVVVRSLTAAAMEVRKVDRPHDGAAVMVVPDGCRLEDLSLFMRERPAWVKRMVTLVDVQSFIRYVIEHKGSETRIFASVLQDPFGLTAVVDYDGTNKVAPAERASFATHICKLACTPTDAWREWRGANKQLFTQDNFATFIEERQPDVLEPRGADMLELARSIEATQGVSFKRKIRLDNGDVSFAFDDKTEAVAGMNGQLRIPEKLVLKFPVFLGMPEQCIECRFRYRLEGGKLALSYEIVRPQEMILTTLRKMLEVVVDETKVPAFMGEYR